MTRKTDRNKKKDETEYNTRSEVKRDDDKLKSYKKKNKNDKGDMYLDKIKGDKFEIGQLNVGPIEKKTRKQKT